MKIVILDGFTATGLSSGPHSVLPDNDCNMANNPQVAPGYLPWKTLEQFGDVAVYDRTAIGDTVARAADAEIVLTNKVVIGRREMDQLPRLQYIGVLATGYNVVDIEAARERGIVVTNIPAYSTMSVSQMVFAHLLAVTNHAEHYADENRRGRWSRSTDFCYWDKALTELSGKTFGIVGLGNIGTQVAVIAHAFGMQVAAYTSKSEADLPPYVRKRSMAELLSESDVVSLHCPLTPDTHHLINTQTLSAMKQSAILINTGRGPLVDDEAVAAALECGTIAAYCADVMTEEPPKADNPLLRQPHAYITPHIAWATTEARSRLIQVAIDNVRAFVDLCPQNVVS